MSWSRLIRFKDENNDEFIGEPVDSNLDPGLTNQPFDVEVFEGSSILDPNLKKSGTIKKANIVLSPLKLEEVGTIRCIGLNYKKHAAEGGFPVPSVPTLFLKPNTALADPYPAPLRIPKFPGCQEPVKPAENKEPIVPVDYEAELGVIIGKKCRDVSEKDALDYVLGYTATNDVSSRIHQFATTQWCFSKGFDGSCPAGPSVVSTRAIPDPSKLVIRAELNGKEVQKSELSDMVFSIPHLVSYLSQGTTLLPGTLIITGTPAGVGWFRNETMNDGADIRVALDHGIGTLRNIVSYDI